MNHLDVGLDKGFSKTNLAIVDADGRVFLQARIDHFEPPREQPITEERLIHLVAQHLAPFKAHPLNLFVAGYVQSPLLFFDGPRSYGLAVQTLEVFNDTHAHYGLTDMPGNAVTVACGSYWNSMYYDLANNVHCFASPRAIWYDVPHSFEGITFACFLLSWWRASQERGASSPLANEILARTSLSPATLRDTIERDPMLDALYPPRWLALGPLISQYANDEPVSSFLDQGISQLELLYNRFCAQVNPPDPPSLVLGGSIWSNVLFERAQRTLARSGIPALHSRGDTAHGAIRFRRANPVAQLEPWTYRFTAR